MVIIVDGSYIYNRTHCCACWAIKTSKARIVTFAAISRLKALGD
jgi:hypothetical protein